jgi:hypothetical protein
VNDKVQQPANFGLKLVLCHTWLLVKKVVGIPDNTKKRFGLTSAMKRNAAIPNTGDKKQF